MKEKGIFILKVVLIVIIVLWIGIVLVDYFQVRQTKDPIFCLKNEVIVYDMKGEKKDTFKKKDFDAEYNSNVLTSMKNSENISYTSVCVGVGYKIYRYHRMFEDSTKNFNAVEFGPFFISERQSAN